MGVRNAVFCYKFAAKIQNKQMSNQIKPTNIKKTIILTITLLYRNYNQGFLGTKKLDDRATNRHFAESDVPLR